MQCPKCKNEFEKVVFADVVVDRCTHCKGLWLDMLEKEDLLALEGSEKVDIGDEQVGDEYNEIRRIDCPVCEQPMIPMVDKSQFHIKYEACTTCYGTFFDAGEFRDLKEDKVLDRFVQLLETLRSNLAK